MINVLVLELSTIHTMVVFPYLVFLLHKDNILSVWEWGFSFADQHICVFGSWAMQQMGKVFNLQFRLVNHFGYLRGEGLLLKLGFEFRQQNCTPEIIQLDIQCCNLPMQFFKMMKGGGGMGGGGEDVKVKSCALSFHSELNLYNSSMW